MLVLALFLCAGWPQSEKEQEVFGRSSITGQWWKERYAKAYSTQYSLVVSYSSTNEDQPCLASQTKWDWACSGWYGTTDAGNSHLAPREPWPHFQACIIGLPALCVHPTLTWFVFATTCPGHKKKDKPLARLTKGKRKRTQINKIINEIGDIISDTTEIQSVIRGNNYMPANWTT